MGRKIRNVIPFDNSGTDWPFELSETLRQIDSWKDIWANVNSCVRLFGGIIQDNGDGTVRVGTGGGMYKTEASSVEGVPAGECEPMTLNGAQGGKLFYADWKAEQNVFLTNNAYNYIFIVWDHSIDNYPFEDDGVTPRDPYDYMDGKRYGNTTIRATTNFYMQDWETDPDYYAWRDLHPILQAQNKAPRRSGMLHAHTVGRVYKMDREITIRVCGTNGWNFNKRLQLFGEEFFPVIRARGLDIEPIEGPNGELQFNVTEGVMWAEMINRFTVREFNMELGDTFYAWYQHTSTDTALTQAELQTNYPHGYVPEGGYMRTRPYDIWYSTVDDKYYRDESDYYESYFNINGVDSYIDYELPVPALVINDSASVSSPIPTSSGSEYKLTVSTDGPTKVQIGTDENGAEIVNQYVNGDATISWIAPDDEAFIKLKGYEVPEQSTISSVDLGVAPSNQINSVSNGVSSAELLYYNTNGTIQSGDVVVLEGTGDVNLDGIAFYALYRGDGLVELYADASFTIAVTLSGADVITGTVYLINDNNYSPTVITTTSAHDLVNGVQVSISDNQSAFSGMTLYAKVLTSTTFEIYSDTELTTTINTYGMAVPTSGSVVQVTDASEVGFDAIVKLVKLENSDQTYTYFEDNFRGNFSDWQETTDYIDNKLIIGTTYPSVVELASANPNGYFNMSEEDPENPGKYKDYVFLQLQATDAYYKFDQDAREWVYFGPKSSVLPQDISTVAFIGNVAGMNTTYPNGYDGKVNVIIQTADTFYYEYSGVEGEQSWIRVHGFVERNGWLRFYGQNAVDAYRYNDLTANDGAGALKDIPDGRYGVAWIYMVHDNSAHVVYGQDHYTAEGAKNANLPTPLPGLLAAYSTLVGKMTFLKGSGTYENAESPFLEKFVSSGVSLHNDLAGLDGGDAGQNKYYHLNEAQYNNVVGATKPNYNFKVTNGTASTSTSTGALVVTGGVGISGELYVGSDITAWASSDARLKDNVVNIEDALEKLLKIGGYDYVWNEKALELFPSRTPKDVGVIAQEVQSVLPEAVIKRDNGYLAVDYDKLIPLLIESIKTLKGEVDNLKQ